MSARTLDAPPPPFDAEEVLTEELDRRLKSLTTAVLDENSRINLTALRTFDACWNGNVLDSLAFLEILDPASSADSAEAGKIKTPKTLLDVGTGGGFPLLPLALAMPTCSCTGLDSIKKKLEAIRRIIAKENIGNVHLVPGRAEDIAHNPAHREHYDCVTSRAVADLSTLLEFCVPFVNVGGHIVLWKSMHAEEEIVASGRAQALLHSPLIFRHSYVLPKDFGERQLLVFKKEKKTPSTYPRDVGIPGKQPLR